MILQKLLFPKIKFRVTVIVSVNIRSKNVVIWLYAHPVRNPDKIMVFPFLKELPITEKEVQKNSEFDARMYKKYHETIKRLELMSPETRTLLCQLIESWESK